MGIPASAGVDGHGGGGGSFALELLIVRVAGERFAIDLRSVEEALERPVLQPMPDMDGGLLGLLRHRDRMLPVYSPESLLGVALTLDAGHVVVLRDGERAVAVAVDEIEDVLTLDPSVLRQAPALGDGDGILRGVALRDGDLIAVVDARAMIDATVPSAELPPEVL